MSEQIEEFVGIAAVFREPTGLDPNFDGGYRGMRMGAGWGRAAYGAHRRDREWDLESVGGFGGIHPSSGPPVGEQRWEEHGRVAPAFDEPGLLRDFNAASPALESTSEAGALERREKVLPERPWMPQGVAQPGYGNRGLAPGGYSEAWARWPMRGGR